jgi:HJR/Mrr/RecB family endonuclease
MKSFESTASAFIGDVNGIKEVTTLHLGDRVLKLDSTLTTTLSGNTKSSQLTISHNGGIALISRMVSNGVCKLKEPSIDGNLLNEASNSISVSSV